MVSKYPEKGAIMSFNRLCSNIPPKPLEPSALSILIGNAKSPARSSHFANRLAKCDDENTGIISNISPPKTFHVNVQLSTPGGREYLFFEYSLQDTSPSPLTTSELPDALEDSTSTSNSHCFCKHCIFPASSIHVSTTVKGAILRSLLILRLLRGLNQVHLTVNESVLMNL
ncbi:uncharacterized protein Bfra_004441 [Botrytis fragariae]|uniref:Uncharacterized protein n=1 Tax=Botrytis fragariae TaxID=1964551 RepID=A0A8H6AVG7_9HELO|nr:uncharacterized protein Bfra_004441 [Botrytis fragariae]KAF5874434.1 hypothetical protein Bfra_004441 [Botrytis fragariae]